MKIFVKTLKGSSFEIDVKPEDTVAHMKRTIESTQGSSVYPAGQLILVYGGSVLKNDSTLAESKVAENGFVVLMLSKSKATSSGSAAASKAPEGTEGDLLGQLAPEEREALERLEAMGFDRALVLEVFFACNKNEELAANYLLDHMH